MRELRRPEKQAAVMRSASSDDGCSLGLANFFEHCHWRVFQPVRESSDSKARSLALREAATSRKHFENFTEGSTDGAGRVKIRSKFELDRQTTRVGVECVIIFTAFVRVIHGKFRYIVDNKEFGFPLLVSDSP